MTDVDEDSPDIRTKKILDLDSPLENHIITTKVTHKFWQMMFARQ